MKSAPLDPETEDYDYLKRFGNPIPALAALSD